MIKITSADRWFSLCVRKRALWCCERCGLSYTPPTQALHCAHVCSRGNWGIRFDPLNAVSLDMGCHLYFTGRPAEFMAWITERIGEEKLNELRRRAKTPAYGIKKQLRVIAKHYRLEHESMALGGEFRGWVP